MDMWSVFFIKNFRERPQHFMGGIAIAVGVAGALLWVLSLVLSLPTSFAVAGPVLIGTAACIFMIGFLAELKVHHELKGSQQQPVVESIAEDWIRNRRQSGADAWTGTRTACGGFRAQSRERNALVVDDCSVMRRIISKSSGGRGLECARGRRWWRGKRRS